MAKKSSRKRQGKTRFQPTSAPTTTNSRDATTDPIDAMKRPFVCLFAGCTHRSKTKALLRKHVLSHLNLYKIPCAGCARVFDKGQGNACYKHLFDCHKGVFPYQCRTKSCYNVYRTQEELNTHGVCYDIRCDMDGCDQTFETEDLRQQHHIHAHPEDTTMTEQVESLIGPRAVEQDLPTAADAADSSSRLFCGADGCLKTFSSDDSRYNHVMIIHMSLDRMSCLDLTCKQTFKPRKKDDYYVHLRSEHAGQFTFVCPKRCWMVFPNQQLLDRHICSPLQCRDRSCRKRFARHFDLQRHYRSAHPDEPSPAEKVAALLAAADPDLISELSNTRRSVVAVSPGVFDVTIRHRHDHASHELYHTERLLFKKDAYLDETRDVMIDGVLVVPIG
ncbi:hypothetical protein BGX29_005844 [Mortierella sp. GBA35]|nr:hypothetical protein BGX29_005844 [Mortierella sp. GBA35]